MITKQEEIEKEIRATRKEVGEAIKALRIASDILIGLPQCIIDHLAEVDIDCLHTSDVVEEIADYLTDLENKTQ